MRVDLQSGVALTIDAPDELERSFADYFEGKVIDQEIGLPTAYEVKISRGEFTPSSTEYEELEFYHDHRFRITGDVRRRLRTSGFLTELLIDENVVVRVGETSMSISYEQFTEFAEKKLRHIVRAAIDAMLFGSGYSLFHGGAFRSRSGRIVLVVGGKAAGKSTTIVRALEMYDASYISNDRAFVRYGPSGLSIIEREADTKLGSRTVDDSPTLSTIVRDVPVDTDTGKHLFNGLYRHLGRPRVTSGIVDTVLIPNISDGREGFTQTAFTEDTLGKHVITDCLGLRLVTSLFGVQPPALRADGLRLPVYEAYGSDGIHACLRYLS